MRLPEVLHRTGYGKAWIYHLINQNRFPSPVKIGARSVAFIESEVDEWIQLTIENSRKHVA
ncbi:helix-turn-helix transcriptional regulator [Escherichia coli]|uniref:helix-turn-helix transcriptional regulator n=1 Tax=Escherichia coli TaxID=562 RepID=UPI0007FB207C|nr:AlpA family transcriptional regulator [Escherichia coli]